MKNTYGDADAKDSAEILLEKEIAALRAEIAELVTALKTLSFAAQTSGGVAGKDDGLVAEIENAEAVLKKYNP